MKILMLIVDDSKKEELEVFLDRSGLEGYTEITHAAGTGSTEPRLGSSAFPKTSAVIFTIVDEDELDRLRAGVDRFCAECGEELRMVAWDAQVLR